MPGRSQQGRQRAPSESSLGQYNSLLEPFSHVLRARLNLPAAAKVGDEHHGRATLDDFRAFAIVTAILGKRVTTAHAKLVLQTNKAFFEGVQPGLTAQLHVPVGLRDRLRDGDLYKRSTRLQLWNKLRNALLLRGEDFCPSHRIHKQGEHFANALLRRFALSDSLS